MISHQRKITTMIKLCGGKMREKKGKETEPEES